MGGGERSRPPSWLAPLTVVLLGIATILAFGYSQRLKREPLVVDRVEYRVPGAKQRETVFSPNGDCRRERIRIVFRTTRTDQADVEIIGPAGKVARTLATDLYVKRYRFHKFFWDGRRDNGRVSGAGRYRVRITLINQDRVLVLPGKIRLHSYEPRKSNCTKVVPNSEVGMGSVAVTGGVKKGSGNKGRSNNLLNPPESMRKDG